MSSESKPTAACDTDESRALAEGRILRRALIDDAGQEYFVYRPAGAGADAELFVAIHDSARKAREQVEAFQDLADRYGVVIVAPHFAIDAYPSYQRLGQNRRSERPGPRADVVLTAIVDEVTGLLGGTPRRFRLFGHAAGGRFALRYAMAHPERVAGVASVAAGTYTFPDPKRRFPVGIRPRPSRPDLAFDMDRFLRVPMTVMEPERSEEDGKRHLERVGGARSAERVRNGRNWVAAMRDAARQLDLEPRVVHRELPRPVCSFEELARDGEVRRSVFEALFGAPPGALSVTPEVVFAKGSSVVFAEAPGVVPYQEPIAGWGHEEPAQEQLRLRRPVKTGLIVILLIAFLAPVAIWARYRSTYVVSQKAVVRGHIADVGARLDGVVESVEVDVGDRVRAGQVIARLQDDHFEAKLRRARSELEKASRELEVERLAIVNERGRLEAHLSEISAGSSAASAEVEAAQSIAQEAKRRLELQRALAREGLVAEEQVRIAETTYRTARAKVAASIAESRASVAAEDLARRESEAMEVRERRISVLESEIETLGAEVELAEANLEDAIIRAPGAGAVVRRIVEPGGAAVVGQPIASVWVGGNVWVEAWVSEDDLAEIETGSEARVTFNSYPGREFRGVVDTVSVSTDVELPDSEVVQPRRERMRDAPIVAVKIRLDPHEEDLFPGLSASVGIRKKDR